MRPLPDGYEIRWALGGLAYALYHEGRYLAYRYVSIYGERGAIRRLRNLARTHRRYGVVAP